MATYRLLKLRLWGMTIAFAVAALVSVSGIPFILFGSKGMAREPAIIGAYAVTLLLAVASGLRVFSLRRELRRRKLTDDVF